ncbi:Hexose phosphate transport protein UhpT [Klebsiella pneumoniae]|uniref:Hexose phosphate transport protein UhpT n=1 Tax=Klebsiella pneumoniae TaxID=573 RepID=A0A2X3I9S6_KLEPN|nr:Hexose phosphate transport protein UhpT [Klebsiella pneumoniae]STT00273.1 Hexose phosphate transport protein UhpT [Klebsiella pneumoniae]
MLAFLNQVRKPTLDLPLDVRRKMWFKPFMQSYLVVFIGYLTMYLIRKNFNIAQNDMISTYGLSMTQLGMIGLGFSITYGVGKTLVSYYADGKNTKQFLPFMLILSAICMLGFSASMGAGSTSLFLMIAFYALSGFFQSTGGSCSYSTITKVDAQTQTRHFPRLLEYLPQPRRRGRGGRGAVWRQLSVRRPCDRHVYLPVDYCADRWLYRPALR